MTRALKPARDMPRRAVAFATAVKTTLPTD